MRIFLDTEFTDLVPHNKLISIALVDEDENYFYAELTDTYEFADCSEFVIEHVLPYLRGGNYNMTFQECALAIGNWIEERNEPCILACDNPSWDIPHLRRLVHPIWPANLDPKMIYPVRVLPFVEEDLVLEYGYKIHNALDDALIMKKATIDK